VGQLAEYLKYLYCEPGLARGKGQRAKVVKRFHEKKR
jgi:hypothetical protein